MSELKRFTLEYDHRNDCDCGMSRSTSGEYVEYEDYKELQAKLAATELLRDVALGEAGIERQRTLKEHNKRIAAEAKNIELQEQVNKIAEFFPVCGEVQCTEQYQKIQAAIKGEK